MTNKYIIVGAEVGKATHFLTADGEIVGSDAPGTTPLDVLYIGEALLELSKNGAPDEAALAIIETRIKHAMTVTDRSEGDPAATALTEDQKQAILEHTEIKVLFETRGDEAGQEINTRILVVPVDGTLAERVEHYAGLSQNPGFEPPLTYELDDELMYNYYVGNVVQAVGDFDISPEDFEAGRLNELLMAHVEEKLSPREFPGEDDIRNQILGKPVSAFLRAVGIYATNMCR